MIDYRLSTDYHPAIMDFMAVLDELRAAVGTDPRGHGTIADAAGIHRKTFSAFMHGRRGLSIETIESLADALSLVIRLEPKTPPPKPRRPAR